MRLACSLKCRPSFVMLASAASKDCHSAMEGHTMLQCLSMQLQHPQCNLASFERNMHRKPARCPGHVSGLQYHQSYS